MRCPFCEANPQKKMFYFNKIYYWCHNCFHIIYKRSSVSACLCACLCPSINNCPAGDTTNQAITVSIYSTASQYMHTHIYVHAAYNVLHIHAWEEFVSWQGPCLICNPRPFDQKEERMRERGRGRIYIIFLIFLFMCCIFCGIQHPKRLWWISHWHSPNSHSLSV